MSDLVINIENLREENLRDVKVGKEPEHTYYINGIPYQSKELKEQAFQTKFNVPQGLRVRKIQDDMTLEEKERMALMAKMIEKVYQRRKAYERPIVESLRGSINDDDEYKTKLERRQLYTDVDNQDVDDYILQDTGNDLSALFVNNKKKENVLAIRGLLPYTDFKDTFQLFEMGLYSILQGNKAEKMGKEYKNDRRIVEDSYRTAKNKYPNHKTVVTGHSRGGKLTLYLGRSNDLEYHAFSPAGNRGDFIDSTPRDRGKLYYHTNDPVAMFHHKARGKTEEQHYEMFNTRLNSHDLTDFYKNKNSVFVKHPVKKGQQRIEEDILLDMKLKDDEVPTAEEMVLADLGMFYDDDEDDDDEDYYFDSEDPKKIKRTSALNLDTPSERKIFNEYIPSVFTDLNMRPVKKFEPITFEEIDGDKNQKITLTELKSYLSRRGYDNDTINELFNTYDVDSDGNITRTEFNNLKSLL